MRKLLLILLVCAPIGLSAQGVLAGSANTYLNNYVQPAPDAAALGRYVDYPVSYYTGTPEISIPLYTLKDGAVNLPISLSYHASGIRVAEVSTWVGLGWTLNAGGMIMRTVKGAPDEGSLKLYGPAQGPKGYYRDSGLTKMPLLPFPGASGDMMDNPSKLMMQMYTIPAIDEGAIDGEPDLFSFNFNGYTGKFVFDEHRTPHLLTDDNLQIAVNYSPGSFNSWVITAPDGTRYMFDSTKESASPKSLLSGPADANSVFPTGWYLTRIIYPNTLDTVYFSYSGDGYLVNDLGPESMLYNFEQYNDPGMNTVCENNPHQNMAQTIFYAWKLASIKSKNYNIVFVADTPRKDIQRGSTAYELDTIKIYNTAGTCLEQRAFHYTYWQSGYGTTCGFCNTYNPAWPIDSSDTRRLKLLSVKEVSGDGTLTKPPYTFTYQDSFALPRRLSYDQDHWGFSNYSSGSNNPFFTPGISLPGITGCSILADRTPKWPQMQAAMLYTIRDPLGVKTQFIYEANSTGYNGIVGGVRIHSITTTDSVTGMQNVRRFVYQGGVLYKMPNYLVNLQNEFFVLPNSLTETPGYAGYSYNGLNNIYAMLKTSQSFVPLQDAQGNHIGYQNVTEIFGNNGQGGSNVYTYQMNLGYHGDSRLSLYNYASLQLVNTVFNGSAEMLIGDSVWNNILPQNLSYYNGYIASLLYPLAPDQIDVMRGKLSNTFTYDSAGNLLKSVYNIYNVNYHEYNWIRGLKVYQIPFNLSPSSPNNNVMGGTPSNLNALTFYKLHTGISHLTSSTETDYKDGKTMTTIHNYGYEDTLHTLQTSDTSVTSQGDSIIKKTYYTFDYNKTATSDSVFGKLKARNMLLPVSTRIWKNNQLISGTITQYQDFSPTGADSFINPAKVYAFQTSSPLTPSQAGENIAFSSPFTSLLPNSSFIEKADFMISGTSGRIIQQKLVRDKDQALIWDNGYHIPLAQVENAYFTDVAFNSFESSETGNWSFNSSSVVLDTSAPTGSHAYTLSSSYPINSGTLNSSQTYVVSYWLKSGASASVSGGTQSGAISGRTVDNWTYHEVKVTGTTSLSITGTGNVDEVRLYPSTAQMTTYTYDGFFRLIAECSVNSTISHYEYDALNRVIDVRDQYGNVVKAFQYNYGRQSRVSQ